MGAEQGGAENGGVEVQAPWSWLRTGARKLKVAFTIKELVDLSSDFSKTRKDGTPRTSGCTAQVVRTDRKQYLFVYRVKCTEKDKDGKLLSAPGGHVVRLKFDFKRVKETHNVNDLDVRASCSCPAFLYWGAQWNLSTGDALYGAPRPKFQPPTEKDRHQYVVCKHIQLVADRISPALDRMLDHYRTEKQKDEYEEKMEQVQVVKNDDEAQAAEPEKPPITPKPVEDDLDAMPEDLTELGLPATPPEEPEVGVKKRKPITPKVPPPAPEPEAPAVEPEAAPEPSPAPEPPPAPPPEEEAPGVKRKRMPPRRKPEPKAPPKRPSNVTVYDDDDETIILPGAKARRMEDAEKEVPPARRAPAAPKTPTKPNAPAPKLPSNITLVEEEDEDDDPITILPGKKHRLFSSRKVKLAAARVTKLLSALGLVSVGA